jgi:hypothetical protein
MLDSPKENDPNRFNETCHQLTELHARHPRSVEMLIPQLCGACLKLRPHDMDSIEATFFIICSAESFHFAILCCLTLVGMVHDLQPQHARKSNQSADALYAASSAEVVSQQRLMRLLHRICCAAVVRSKGLTDSHGVKILRNDRHFISESSFFALLLSSSGYGGLNFLDSIRDDIEKFAQRPDGDALMASPDRTWSAPAWLTRSMQQRLRLMCDTMWLLSKCVGFSEELRSVADRPSRRARLSSLLQVPRHAHARAAPDLLHAQRCPDPHFAFRVSTMFFPSARPTSPSPSATPFSQSSPASPKPMHMCFPPKPACPTLSP